MIIKLLLILKWIYYLLVILTLLFSWKLALLLVLVRAVWNRFYVVRKVPIDLGQSLSEKILLSPVHGTIQDILEMNQRIYIKITMDFFAHKGIYALGNSTVDSIDHFDRARTLGFRQSIKKLVLRQKYRAMYMSFLSIHGNYSVSIMKTAFSIRPSTMLMPGDRTTHGAHIGWMPLGGVVLIDLPLSGRLLVSRGQKLKMFHTRIMEFNKND